MSGVYKYAIKIRASDHTLHDSPVATTPKTAVSGRA